MTNRTIYRYIVATTVSFVLLLAGCSNFLTDYRVDPDGTPVHRVEASIDAVISADVAEGAITAMTSVSVDISWNEEVEGFKADDLVIENAAVSSFDGSGRDYSFILDIEAEGVVAIDIAEGSLAGVSGDTNTEVSFGFLHQVAALTLSISSTESILTNQASIPLDFIFSEEVTDFDAADISVDNGSISGFSGKDAEYSGILTFDADGATNVVVSLGAARDAAEGLRDSSAAAFTITYDGTAPVPVLSSSIIDGSTAGFRSLVFDVLFPEPVDGFDSADFDVFNASLSNFSGSGDSYQISVTPLVDGPVDIAVSASAASDAAGNDSEASDTFSYTYDSSKVGLNFSSSEGDPTNAATIVLDMVFGMEMSGFDIDDLELTGATAGNFSGSGDTYAVEIYPSSDGEVSITVPEDVAISTDGNGFENVESPFSFDSDRTAPLVPVFELTKNSDGTAVAAGTIANDILDLSLDTDYSSDNGSLLVYEYTTDGGSNWDTFVNPTYLSAEQIYPGINIRVSDEVGNVSTGSEIADVGIDTSVPNSPIPVIITDPVNASNTNAFAFQITSAEADTTFDWILSSDGGGSDITGTGIIGADDTADVTGIDISGLGDGNLIVQAKLTDAGGNVSGWGQDGTIKDTVVPLSLLVTILAGDPITSADNDAFAFEFSGGEPGLDWTYLIASDAGGPTISETGTFDDTGYESISDIDLSAFPDGNLTVTVTQVDDAGNQSTEAEEGVVLDARAVNIVTFPDLVDTDNVAAVPLELDGEDGSTYTYTISSSQGGTPLTATGSYNTSGEADFSLDLSVLNDGYLVILVDVVDESGNTAREFLVSQKNTATPPSQDTADFSEEVNTVTFDASFHGYQTVPSGSVRFDTKDIIGSDHDDVFKFSALEDDETFTLDAGIGFDIIDLSNYPSYDVTIYEGQVAENQGTITIDLGGAEIATIEYAGVERIEFSANNFTGSPHAIEMDSSAGTQWVYQDTWFDLHTYGGTYHTGVVDFEGSLGLSYQLDTTFKPILDMANKNGLIIFDFQDIGNYKYVRAYAKANKWTVGEVIDGSESTLATLNETIDETTENALQLRVTGDDGMTAELWSGGVLKTSYTFDDPLNDGRFGITNNVAHTEFTIDMTPTNWAPYVKSYDQVFSQALMDEVVLDVIGDAVDYEDESLSIIDVSSSPRGTLSVNGDGTLTYVPNETFLGIDYFTVTVTDGINTTVGNIRFDVMP